MTDLPPSPKVDLTTCDFEPIHEIGRIQSFGYLLSFSSDWIVNFASLNCAELFARPAQSLIGAPGHEVVDSRALHEIRSRLQMLGSPDSVERMFDIELVGDGRLFDLAVHMSGRSFIIEAEPGESGKRRDYVGYVRPMIERMRKTGDVHKLCESAARQLRALTGFDRVMIYRFGPSGAGEVIAESLSGTIESYRGLHFPASDIPAQARRLYARNLLRIITDVDDPTVPIIPATDPDGQPLDLSMSGLRAVSPIHIEYLGNMGVKASMSVSIMRRDKLWGLIACHHYSPLRLSYPVRSAAELFGEFFAYLLEQAETDDALARRATAVQLHDRIMVRLAGGTSLLTAFDDFAETIGKVIPFDGAVGWVDGQFVNQGITPSREQFIELARFLNTAGASTVWSSNHLSAVFAPAAAYSERAAGVLALPVSRSPRDYIVLFRREFIHQVNWAGDPSKPVEVGPLGARLTPRKSFDIWKEERRGQSRAWEADEIATAESLRVTLLEVVLRLADSAHREREQASAHQDFLIAELNHRVRNILNLIRGLVSQSRASAQTIDQFAEIVGNRIYALARAHDLVTRNNWTPASIHGLVRTECKAYVADSVSRLNIAGVDALLQPGAFSTMALVIHELTTNSCKYGALSDNRGRVAMTLQRRGDGGLEVLWAESGGPAVKPPERRGFGSAIIERTVPHELGGEAEIDYPESGVVARFVLPAAQIASFGVLPSCAEAEPAPAEPDAGPARETLLDGQVLVVEDNMIIAMETEEILRGLGCAQCHGVASVADALAVLDGHEIRFGLLDINLGKETSAPVAAALAERGTPFIFASGYGEGAAVPRGFESVPIVTKPYSPKDIFAAIASLKRD